MLTTRIFRPVFNSGKVYAGLYGSSDPMQSIGGVEELKLDIKEDVKKQKDFSQAGGGTRAQVRRIDSVGMGAKLQDLNMVNLARAVFGTASTVAASTVSDEAHKAYKGGLIRLAHLNPSTVVVNKGASVIAAAGNYEVLPEGILIYDTAAGITDGDDLLIDYAHSGYDLIEALTTAAPILRISFAGVNEADNAAPSVVDLYRVQLGATKSLSMINKDFGTLDIDGEVLMDPSINGASLSRFFRIQQV